MLKFIDFNAILFSFPETTRPMINCSSPLLSPSNRKPSKIKAQHDTPYGPAISRQNSENRKKKSRDSALVHLCIHIKYMNVDTANI